MLVEQRCDGQALRERKALDEALFAQDECILEEVPLSVFAQVEQLHAPVVTKAGADQRLKAAALQRGELARRGSTARGQRFAQKSELECARSALGGIVLAATEAGPEVQQRGTPLEPALGCRVFDHRSEAQKSAHGDVRLIRQTDVEEEAQVLLAAIFTANRRQIEAIGEGERLPGEQLPIQVGRVGGAWQRKTVQARKAVAARLLVVTAWPGIGFGPFCEAQHIGSINVGPGITGYAFQDALEIEVNERVRVGLDHRTLRPDGRELPAPVNTCRLEFACPCSSGATTVAAWRHAAFAARCLTGAAGSAARGRAACVTRWCGRGSTGLTAGVATASTLRAIGREIHALTQQCAGQAHEADPFRILFDLRMKTHLQALPSTTLEHRPRFGHSTRS